MKEAEATYTFSVSGKVDNLESRVAIVLRAGLNQGCNITSGIGIWEGHSEPSVTVTAEATVYVAHRIEELLATIKGLRWVHVTVSQPATYYIDLERHHV